MANTLNPWHCWYVQDQVSEEQDGAEVVGARHLAAQRGLGALLKRAVVLHGGKMVALSVWWAAIQRPGAVGWLLTGAHGEGWAE